MIEGRTGPWETVIGLEVHAQVVSKAKLFSGAATDFGAEPNTQVSPVDADQLIPSGLAMAEHLLTLPPASRVNTVHMMRQMRPLPSPEQQRLAAALKEHGAKSDLIESRTAFAEKRAPNFKGWDKPEDRYRLPTIESAKG